MLYYEVKLIHPETKEVFFNVTSVKPKLPSQDILDRYKGAILVIRTTSSPENNQ